MSGLSEEEKKRIQNIEDARAEARKNIKKREEWQKAKPGVIALVCLGLAFGTNKLGMPSMITYSLVALGIVFLIVFSKSSSE